MTSLMEAAAVVAASADTLLEGRASATVRQRSGDGAAESLLLTLENGMQATMARVEYGTRAPSVKVGDALDVFVVALKDDVAQVSERKAEALALWDAFASAAGGDTTFDGEIVAEIKGGFVVDVGLRGFLPMSQADARPVDVPARLLGKRSRFHVVEFNSKRGTVVLSRRAFAEAEREQERTVRLQQLTVGDVVDGIVRRLVAFGAFVDVGGAEGLLHLTDVGWGRISAPGEVLSVGQKVRVKVLEIERGSGKLKVGRKQTMQDPWGSIGERYKEGQRVRGKVVSIASFGAFLEIEPGIEGLVHISEMSWTEHVSDPATLAPLGAELEVVVLGIDARERRLSLGLRQTAANPWKAFARDNAQGSTVRGVVKAIERDGVVVRVGELDGFVHRDDISWETDGSDATDRFNVGDNVEAVVLGVNPRSQRLELGIKQLTEDPWAAFATRHPRGSTVNATVKELVPNGVTVEIEPGFDAFCHVSQLSLDRIKVPSDAVKRGQSLEAQVSEVDAGRRRMTVSVRALLQGETDYRAYMTDGADKTSPLAEALGPIAQRLRDGSK